MTTSLGSAPLDSWWADAGRAGIGGAGNSTDSVWGRPVRHIRIRVRHGRTRNVDSQESTSFWVVGFDIRWLSTQALGG
jgi:hypothetical protein